MTIGIYALYWEEQDLIYIGLSQNIEGRFTDHKYNMKNQNHTNYKVQNAFNTYGVPTLFILEKCLIEELNNKEIQWMQEFDALGAQGLCIVEGGQVGFGTNSNGSKYSRRTILKIFSLLYRTDISCAEIAEKVGVPRHLVQGIHKRKTHFWLHNTYPEKWFLIESKRVLRKENSTCLSKRYSVETIIISPSGEEYRIINIRRFCEEVLLPISRTTLKHVIKGLSRLINKNTTTYKGWRLK